MWASGWVGLEYADLGRGPSYDCLGLFLAVHAARFGSQIADPGCTIQEATRLGIVSNFRSHVAPVTREDVQEGDALLFFAAGRPLHVGYALDGRDMLHIDRHNDSRIERWIGPSWLGKLEGIYRFA